MDPVIKEKWIKALRSGEYKQGIGVLRNRRNEFCCLGVLCNIHAQEHPETASKETKSTSYLGNTQYLPDEVANWSKIGGFGGGLVTIDKKLLPLATHNDSGRTFEQIADAIEKEL
jgi:hypothetical protein